MTDAKGEASVSRARARRPGLPRARRPARGLGGRHLQARLRRRRAGGEPAGPAARAPRSDGHARPRAQAGRRLLLPDARRHHVPHQLHRPRPARRRRGQPADVPRGTGPLRARHARLRRRPGARPGLRHLHPLHAGARRERALPAARAGPLVRPRAPALPPADRPRRRQRHRARAAADQPRARPRSAARLGRRPRRPLSLHGDQALAAQARDQRDRRGPHPAPAQRPRAPRRLRRGRRHQPARAPRALLRVGGRRPRRRHALRPAALVADDHLDAHLALARRGHRAREPGRGRDGAGHRRAPGPRVRLAVRAHGERPRGRRARELRPGRDRRRALARAGGVPRHARLRAEHERLRAGAAST